MHVLPWRPSNFWILRHSPWAIHSPLCQRCLQPWNLVPFQHLLRCPAAEEAHCEVIWRLCRFVRVNILLRDNLTVKTSNSKEESFWWERTPKFLRLAVTSSCCCWRVDLKSWNSWLHLERNIFYNDPNVQKIKCG